MSQPSQGQPYYSSRYTPPPPPPPAKEKRHWTDSPTKVLGLVAAIISVITGLFGLASQLGAFGDFRIPFLPGRDVSAQISLSPQEGPSGSQITVTGQGFDPDEGIEIRYAVNVIAQPRADDHGDFTAEIIIPGTLDAFAPRQVDIIATGRNSIKTATTSYHLLAGGKGGDSTGPATISLSRGSGPSGTEVTVKGSNFSAGEEVTIRISGEEIGVATVGSDGTFEQSVTIPGSFDAYGSQQHQITATGNTSIKTASRPFRITT
jgi:IPT/TIG domain